MDGYGQSFENKQFEGDSKRSIFFTQCAYERFFLNMVHVLWIIKSKIYRC